jgi:hypothetical protein
LRDHGIFEERYLKQPFGEYTVKHTQFPPIDDASVSSVVSRQKSNSGKGFFSGLFEALHESRRLQAARVIQQHRHLIDRAHKAEAAKRAVASAPTKEVPQIVHEAANASTKPGAKMSFSAKLILASVIAGFGVLHFIADGVLRHGPGIQPTEDRMPLANRD